MTAIKWALASGTKLKHRIIDSIADTALRLKTTGRIEPFELDVAPQSLAGAHAYQAAPYLVLSKMFAWIKKETATESFFDIGCGKGRAMYMAHVSGCKSLMGLDHSEEMCLAARFNLGKKGVGNSEIYCQDAREVSFPSDPCIFFMNNPFGTEVLRPVAKNLIDQMNPDSLLAFVNPLREHVLRNTGFKRIETLDSYNHNYKISFYRK